MLDKILEDVREYSKKNKLNLTGSGLSEGQIDFLWIKSSGDRLWLSVVTYSESAKSVQFIWNIDEEPQEELVVEENEVVTEVGIILKNFFNSK
jgi:hypothetical protein